MIRANQRKRCLDNLKHSDFLLEEIIVIRQEPLGIFTFIKVPIFKNFVARNYS